MKQPGQNQNNTDYQMMLNFNLFAKKYGNTKRNGLSPIPEYDTP